METKADLRKDIGRECSFRPPVGDRSFRKDDLNQILREQGGDALPASEVYAHDSHGKGWFYEQVAEEAGFEYDYDGDTPRPYQRSELEQVRDSVGSPDR